MQSEIFYSGKPDGDWLLLATQNESTGYDIDVSEIWFDRATGKFLLLTAEGCSCWGGEYEKREFDYFDAINEHLKSRDSDSWVHNPTPVAAEKLIADAKAAFLAV